MVESQQLAHVASDRSLRGDQRGDLGVDLPLKLVDLGIIPAHLVRELRVALHQTASRPLQRLLDPRPESQHVVLHAVQGSVERRPGSRAAGLTLHVRF